MPTRIVSKQGIRGGRITIPPDLMEHLDIKPGQELELKAVTNDMGDVIELRRPR